MESKYNDLLERNKIAHPIKFNINQCMLINTFLCKLPNIVVYKFSNSFIDVITEYASGLHS